MVIAATISPDDSRSRSASSPWISVPRTALISSRTVGESRTGSVGIAYAGTPPATPVSAALAAGTSSSTTRFATTARTEAWWWRASSTAMSAATRTCSGVLPLLDTTSTIGLLRLAATRALNENSVGDAMSV